jgi:D-lactate dehydrogenase
MEFKAFYQSLRQQLPAVKIIDDELRRFAYSTDASFYRMVPRLIVLVENEADVIIVMRAANKYQVSLTFRAAGTSLSGQAVTDQVLVMLADGWQAIRIDPLGERVHLQPGVIGAKANVALQVYGRKIGPDPASINACKIGGIVANNASGMCCGTQHNSYHTLAAIRLILADGTILDTADDKSVEQFRKTHALLCKQLLAMRNEVLANDVLCEKVRRKYRLKNTTGYGLNALLDYDDPVDIFSHLVVGSEGTLAFISEVSLDTVPDLACRASAMVAFETLTDCAQAVTNLKLQPVDAVELLDARAVASIRNITGAPTFTQHFPELGGLLLIDVRGQDPSELARYLLQVEAVLAQSSVWQSTGFTTDKKRIDDYWTLRKGTFPAVGAVRQVGTTVIIEDVAFPIEQLANGIARLQMLFEQYGYQEAIIFGHALEGNLHFVFTQTFESSASIEQYRSFMADVSQLVAVEYGGSLKAEHGTGRNMAPFVAMEWGDDAYGLMRRIKDLFDPEHLLNPGVILNDDPEVHLKNLKQMVAADDSIDRCIECGFCEEVCPSRSFNLSPRQRIAVYRETQRRQQSKENISGQWGRDFQRMVVDSCAATGLCAQRCPVNINTGDLVLKIRGHRNYPYRRLATYAVRHFAALASWTRAFLMIGAAMQWLFGPLRLEQGSAALRRISKGKTPLWLSTTPTRAQPVYARRDRIDPTAQDTVVYWPSCVSQSMGKSLGDDRIDIPVAVRRVLDKAHLNLVFPQPTRGLCCGQPLRSKGHGQLADQMLNEVLDTLWEVSSGGRYPVLSDTSPCALQLKLAAQQRGIHLYDSSEFIDRFLLSRLSVQPETKPVAVHVTCSTQKQGIEQSMKRVLDKVAPQWMAPDGIYCCGFAGDKGFLLPELNASALKSLPLQVADCAYGISTSRTCEIGLSRHSGLTYYSLFEVLDRQSQSYAEPLPED